MIAVESSALTLADLEAFDPLTRDAGSERRFNCPLATCAEKGPTPAHRSLAANVETGLWMCHRCLASGKLQEFWTQRSSLRRDSRTTAARRAFSLTPSPPSAPRPAPTTSTSTWRKRLTDVEPLVGTPAAEYLRSRGLEELAAAEQAGVGYVEVWRHWRKDGGSWELLGTSRRVVFPLVDRQGETVAISARAIDAVFLEPMVDTRGERSAGVFATPGALDDRVLIIVEAPIDALTLHEAGFPSIALCGTSWPDWLPLAAAFKTVFLATDADGAGDRAALALERALSFGSRCYRLRPFVTKDWNEELQRLGADQLHADVVAPLLRVLRPSALVEDLPLTPADEEPVGKPASAMPPGPVADTALLATRLLGLGEQLGWVALPIERGLTLVEGEAGWRLFAELTPRKLEAAVSSAELAMAYPF